MQTALRVTEGSARFGRRFAAASNLKIRMIEQIAQQLLVQSVVNPFDDLNAFAEMHTQLQALEKLAGKQ